MMKKRLKENQCSYKDAKASFFCYNIIGDDMQEGLDRFLKAHEMDYQKALREIENGHKDSHWIWYIFPNLRVFAGSEMASYYGLRDYNEAYEYFNHPVLRAHFLEITEALFAVSTNRILDIMDFPDNLKVQSSLTLFSIIEPENELIKKTLAKYYDAKEDEKVKLYIKMICHEKVKKC